MTIFKTKQDKYGWRTIFKYRKSMDKFIIETKSINYPQNNSEIWLSKDLAIEFSRFVKKCLV
jgi:hypothetical protein